MAKKDKKNAATPGDDGPPRGRRFWRYCFVLALAGVTALAWLSMLSFNPNDPPSPNVESPRGPVNRAGIVGAYLAYAMHYWLGGGAYMVLLFATVAALVMMFGGRVTHLPWRIFGVAMLTTATSAALFLHSPQAGMGPANSPAGVLGIGVGEFLTAKFGPVGGWLIAVVALLIGVMLTAEKLVLQLPRLGRKVWQQRKELPGMIAALKPAMVRTAPARGEVTASPRAAAAVPATASRAAPKPAPAPKAPPVPPPVQAKAEPAETEKPKPLLRLLGRKKDDAPKPASEKPEKKPAEPRRTEPAGEAEFRLPSADLLAEPSGGYNESQEAAAAQKRDVLQQTLNNFNVAAEVVNYSTGPVITMYELSLAPGVKVSQVSNLCTDISRALAVPGVRVVSPLPGKDTVGIEVPNLDKEIVRIKELMQMAPEAERQMHLPVYLGKDASGGALVSDLASMPHMLIAGTTGSGKSVCINAIIMSLLLTRRPDEVRLVLVDPKMVEMAAFENIPHLLCPIVNDMRRVSDILEWAATKMDERYELLKEAGVRNIAAYNRLSEKDLYERFHAKSDEEKTRIPKRIQYYVIIVDELADLMMTNGKEVEGYIIRIAQKARAVGIHLVLATQRPSVNVVTGLIKSNMPCRISFRVASRQESRIVLDQNGADVLLGQGDMLFLKPGTSNLVRSQGTYVDDAEIRTVVRELRGKGEPEYNSELVKLQAAPSGEDSGQRDDLFDQAVEIVLVTRRGSVSLLQRKLNIGYSRSSRIIEQMADAGILGDYKGSQARECLISLEDWEAIKAAREADETGESALNGEPTSA